MLLKDTNFAYDVYYGVLTGTVRTNNGVIKEQIKEQMKILHDKKKIAELGLEQGVGFVPTTKTKSVTQEQLALVT
jgi:hypothetical protein